MTDADSTPEHQGLRRMGWLRAAVLGANDGIVSTACLLLGMAAATTGRDHVLLAGFASLVAGAASMAAGEYVSVASQADTEAADLARERAELASDPVFERHELAAIYQARGLPLDLSLEVADALMAHDALGAHARDELGLSDMHRARPVQAAITSAATFAVGAALPLAAAALLPLGQLALGVSIAALLFLMLLGGVGAAVGGAPVGKGVLRVAFWGVLAMAATYGIGSLFGTAVA